MKLASLLNGFLVISLASACGRESSSESNNGSAVAKSPAVHSQPQSVGLVQAYSVAYPAYAGWINGSRYSVFAIAQYNYFDAEYLQALKLRAEAALVAAKAKAAREQALIDAVKTIEREILSEMNRLDQLLARIETTQIKVMTEGRRLDALERGEATPENVAAVDFMLELSSQNRSQLMAVAIPALGADQFVSRGAYRVEVTADGERVLHKNEVVAFAGGNGAEFLEFLRKQRQNPKAGSAAASSLLNVTRVVATVGQEWFAASEAQARSIRAQRTAELAKLIELVGKLEALANQDESAKS